MYIATWVIQTILHKISMYLFCLPKKSQVQKYFWMIQTEFALAQSLLRLLSYFLVGNEPLVCARPGWKFSCVKTHGFYSLLANSMRDATTIGVFTQARRRQHFDARASNLTRRPMESVKQQSSPFLASRQYFDAASSVWNHEQKFLFSQCIAEGTTMGQTSGTRRGKTFLDRNLSSHQLTYFSDEIFEFIRSGWQFFWSLRSRRRKKGKGKRPPNLGKTSSTLFRKTSDFVNTK